MLGGAPLWVHILYLHSLYSLCNFNSLHGSSPAPSTYIYCVHCIHSIHCIHCLGLIHYTGPLHHLVTTFTASTVSIAYTAPTASTTSTASIVSTARVQFIVGVPITTLYRHSMCPLCILFGFTSQCGSPSPPCTYIHCVYCMGSISCMDPHHPYVPTFAGFTPFKVFTAFNAFTMWVQFTEWVPTSTMYLHSLFSLYLLHSLCGLNSQCGSPMPPCTYIHCIHCVHCMVLIHSVGPHH